MDTRETLNARLEQRFKDVMGVLVGALSRLRDQEIEPPEQNLREAYDALRRIVRARKPDAVDHAADLLCDRPGCETLTGEELYQQVLEWETESLNEIACKLMRLAIVGEGASPEADLVAGVTLTLMADAMIEEPDVTPDAHTRWFAATLQDDARFNRARRRAHLLLRAPRHRDSVPRRGPRVRVRSRRSTRTPRRVVRAGPERPRRADDEPDLARLGAAA